GTASPAEDEAVQTLHARRGSVERIGPLGKFMERLAPFFANGGMMIDQAYQPRLSEGMIRCYMSQGEVAGYGQQLIKALVPTPPSGPTSAEAQPGPRIMYPPETPQFEALRQKMEDEWVPGLRDLLDIEADSLPVLWDADFLYGPKTPDGEDTYVLCEINVSAVAPFPESAAEKIAAVAAERLRSIRQARK
ncbi:MAG TPA: Cj0069 family protein, partial [Caulobacteraceae bacterium]|nr:Cj0069 family protein [Caulobacteraceae bacterium]